MKDKKKERKAEQMPGYSNAREPSDSFDYVNMYGTYNIQPTADHGNEYPAIAQGISRMENEERRRARESWKKGQAKKPRNGGRLEADPNRGLEDDGIELLNDRNE